MQPCEHCPTREECPKVLDQILHFRKSCAEGVTWILKQPNPPKPENNQKNGQ